MMTIQKAKKIGIFLGAMLIFSLSQQVYSQAQDNSGYMAREEGVKGIFDALSSVMGKPVILSKIAARKKITGEFDLAKPEGVLAAASEQLGLIWYNDGQAIYVYDASEMRNAIIVLHNTSFNVVSHFLKAASLYDSRYPLRSDNRNSTFYVSGPPIYVDIISSTAKYLDKKSDGFDGRENIAIIPLYNAFVEDRVYRYRDEKITIPGVSRVINQLMDNGVSAGGTIQTTPAYKNDEDETQLQDFTESYPGQSRADPIMLESDVKASSAGNRMSIIPDPGSNSLLVKGSAEQVAYIRNLVNSMDVPKRHIELSVWIVDLQKDTFDNLGIQWTGNVNVGSNLGISLNGGTSTIDGASFMVTALALSEKNQANIVSRPMILTQENIPAIFDNNRTFYTKLVGERTAQLQNVTYGTLLSVLPRFTENGEVEMMLNVEDGNQYDRTKADVNDLPEVGRTNISTIARVPKGKSLLIGGYTRDEDGKVKGKIPLLGDIPWIGGLFSYSRDRTSNMVRVFLIQPREIDTPLNPDANALVQDMKKDFSSNQLQNWMTNYLDSQKWH